MSIFVAIRLTALDPAPAAQHSPWNEAIKAFDAIVEGQIRLYGGRVYLRSEGQITAQFDGDTKSVSVAAIECALEIYRHLGRQEWFLEQLWQQRIAIHATNNNGYDLPVTARTSDEAALDLAHAILDSVPGPPILLTPAAAALCPIPAAAVLQDLGVHLLQPVGQLHKILGLSPGGPSSVNYFLATPLLARSTELAQVGQWLTEPACRLLTIVGPGGAGKTHLALHAAAGLNDAFEQGVFFIPLVVLSSTERLIPLIAATLNVPLAGATGNQEPKTRLMDYLRSKEMLLIIDNLEHLVVGAELLQELLQAAPRLKILSTSRERLNLAGEWTLEIGGLSFPPENVATDTNLEAYGAVQLFISRARQTYPAFALSARNRTHLAEICRLVQGLPLALELAAAWVGTLTCREIAYQIGRNLDFLTTSRLALPERQRSLRAAFDYSWALLNETERALYCRLAVFQGSFSREAASQVADAGLALLARLADKSLLRRVSAGHHQAGGRYEILGVLHVYAERALQERPQDAEAVAERHCIYYTEFLERHEREFYGTQYKKALEAVAAEIENIRAGWRWASNHGRLNCLERALRALHLFYDTRGYYREGQQLIEIAIAAVEPVATVKPEDDRQQQAELLLGRLYARLAEFSSRLGQLQAARTQVEDSLVIARRYGAAADEAFALNTLGYLCQNTGTYEEAREFLQRSLEIYQSLDEAVGMARVLNNLGIVSRMLGDYDATARYYQTSLTLYRQLGDQQGIARTLLNLAAVVKMSGDSEGARQACLESLALFRATGNQRGIVASLNNLGSLAKEAAVYHEAWDYFQKSLAIRQEIGDDRGISLVLVNLGEVADALGRGNEAKEYFRDGIELALKTSATPRALIALTGMASILQREGHLQEAVEVIGFILNQSALIQVNREKAEYLLSELRSEVGADDLSRLLEQGQQRTLDSVVNLSFQLH
jgi:predicted ATPase